LFHWVDPLIFSSSNADHAAVVTGSGLPVIVYGTVNNAATVPDRYLGSPLTGAPA
jgi:hypothetical protein